MAQRDFRVWDQVPAGARLYLRLEVEGAALARGCAVLSAAGVPLDERDVPHVEMLEGGYVLELEPGTGGTVTVSVHFPAPRGTAVLHAAVVDREGRPFKRPFRYEVAGSRGDTFRATLLLTGETLDLEHDPSPEETR